MSVMSAIIWHDH